MNVFDLQRIENAVWVLSRYRDELDDTGADICVDGSWFDTNDALRVLEMAVERLKDQK